MERVGRELGKDRGHRFIIQISSYFILFAMPAVAIRSSANNNDSHNKLAVMCESEHPLVPLLLRLVAHIK